MVNLESFHIEFKLLYVSGTLGLVVTITPRTAKVVGSNLMKSPVFFEPEIFRFKKKFGMVLVCLCFVGLIGTSLNCFLFCCTQVFFCFKCFD